jgi:hypothetical protein
LWADFSSPLSGRPARETPIGQSRRNERNQSARKIYRWGGADAAGRVWATTVSDSVSIRRASAPPALRTMRKRLTSFVITSVIMTGERFGKGNPRVITGGGGNRGPVGFYLVIHTFLLSSEDGRLTPGIACRDDPVNCGRLAREGNSTSRSGASRCPVPATTRETTSGSAASLFSSGPRR